MFINYTSIKWTIRTIRISEIESVTFKPVEGGKWRERTESEAEKGRLRWYQPEPGDTGIKGWILGWDCGGPRPNPEA